MTEKAISIKCGGERSFQLDELVFFQGQLKSITEQKFKELKQSLVDRGLPLAFHVWIDGNNKVQLIDGHSRYLALKALREDGYFIPPIPCNVVKAKTKKEAAQVVLVSNSKYGTMTQESFSDFAIEHELNIDDLTNLDLPDLDMSGFNLTGNEEGSDDEDEADGDAPRFIVEIELPNQDEQNEIYNELIGRGLIVRRK